MSLLGNIVRENKKQAAAIPPPATVTDANNGTSLSGTTVQLGQALGAVGNPAIMLNNREIPMGGFDFQFINGAGRKFLLDPSGVTQYILGDVDNTEGHNAHLDVLGSLGFIQATLFTGAGPVGQFSIGSNGTGGLIGSDGAGNQFGHEILNNAVKTRYIDTGNGESGITAQNDGANPYVFLQALDAALNDRLELSLRRDKLEVIGAVGGVTAFPLLLDLANNIYKIGDTGPYNNGTQLVIDDATERVSITNSGNLYMDLNIATNTMQFIIGDTTFGAELVEFNGNASGGNAAALIYVQDNAANDTSITVDANTRQITCRALNGIRTTVDTTMIHTGTNYANGAAAALGTLTNAPAAGNPTKWVPIDDNGTTRYIPAW